jgi:L-rhamnose mutarotase
LARSELQDTSCIQATFFSLIAERSPYFLSESSEVKDFENLLRIEEREKQQKQYEIDIKKQIESKFQEQANAELEELFHTYEEELKRERDSLREQNEELKDELSQKDDEARKWKRLYHTAWQSRQLDESEDEYIPGYSIFLSGKACKQFDSFDLQEQSYWEEHVLEKLLDEQLRDRQSERRGSFWVYPRKKSAGGRRAIYYSQDTRIYVCELLKHDQEYEQLSTAMSNKEIGPGNYDGFEQYRACEAIAGEMGNKAQQANF